MSTPPRRQPSAALYNDDELTFIFKTPFIVRALGLLAIVSLTSCSKDTVVTTPTPTVDPPTITCGTVDAQVSPLSVPIAVTYPAPTVKNGKEPVTTSCTPASGSTFALGSTTVTCVATDAIQRTSSCSLTVTVNPRQPLTLTKFVAFGDSTTWGEDGQNSLTLSPFVEQPVLLVGRDYPTVLRTSLQTRYPLQLDQISVLNLGNPGEFVGDATTLTRFNQYVIGRGYQSVLIMEGANDVNFGISDSRQLSLALANLRTMVQRARNSGVQPFLATIPPMDPTKCTPRCRGVGAALVSGFNDQIRSIATLEATPLVDVHAAFAGDLSLLSADGLHPNASGYQRIADTFRDVIVRVLERPALGASGVLLP